jgi:DNA-binding GntR family transcriptional regulator
VIEEIASLRVKLEPFAIELALPRLRSEPGRSAMQQLTAELGRSAAGGDVVTCIDIHLRLHRTLYELSGHKLLLDCWRSWESQLRVYFALDASTFTSLSTLVADHERLTDLLLNADVETISADIVAHVQVAADHAVDTVRQTGSQEA